MSGPGYEQLTLFQEASHASHLVWPGSDGARTMTATSGLRCLELYRKSGPLGSLVRMLLGSSIYHSTRCYLTWKTSVTPAKRLLFRLAPSMPRTKGKDARLLPTPTAQDGKNSTLPPSQRNRGSLPGYLIRMYPTPKANCSHGPSHAPHRQGSPDLQTACGGTLNPDWVEWLMAFPPGWTDIG